jgi:NitT/TauT family transport system substrate-binding protein
MTRMTEMSPAFPRRRAGSPPHRLASGIPGGSRRRVIAAAAATAAVLAVAACGSNSSGAATARTGPEKKDIVVAAVPAEGAAGLYIAADDGLFAKAGLHVTIQTVTSSSTVIPAMLHGTVDVASGQYTSYIAADASGAARMKIVAAGYSLGSHVQEIVVGPHSTITSLAGLKGKTVAVNAPNGETTDLLYSALAPFGVTPAQVHVTVLPFPAMAAAVATGHVDAAYLVEPYITEGVKQFGIRELADIDSGASQLMPISGYAVLSSWAAKYPRTAAAFAKAIEEGNQLAGTNLADLQNALQAQLHLSPTITGVMATGTFPTNASSVQLQRVADLMLKYGQLTKPFAIQQIIGG